MQGCAAAKTENKNEYIAKRLWVTREKFAEPQDLQGTGMKERRKEWRRFGRLPGRGYFYDCISSNKCDIPSD
jgi:hypothetical protein